MKKFFTQTLLLLLFISAVKTTSAQLKIWTWIKGDSSDFYPGNYGTQGVASPINFPMGRALAANWKDNAGNMWMYGGVSNDWGGGGYYLSDLWKYDPAANIWTWMKGDSGFHHKPAYGAKGIAGAPNTPGDKEDPAYWKDNAGNLWMYAGFGCASDGCAAPTNDLWKYDVATNQWTFVSGDTLVWQHGIVGTMGVPAAINLPASRTAPQGWCDGAGNFWVFSGSSSYPGLWPTTDMWRYNPVTNIWTWMNGDPVGQAPAHYGVKGVASSANIPPARSYAATWTDMSGNLWMYGGSKSNTYYTDLWMFNPSANQWTWMNGDSSAPQQTTYGTLGTAAPTNTPGARVGASWWRDDVAGDLWLFGGSNYAFASGRGFKDVWRYNIASNMWTWFAGDTTSGLGIYNTQGVADYTNFMPTRNNAAAWVDSASGKLFVACGQDRWTGYYLYDVWTYVPPFPFPFRLPLNLLSFTARLTSPSPAGRGEAALLQWTTTGEENTDRFEVQNSAGSSGFATIGSVKAAGQSSTNRSYSFTHNIVTTTSGANPPINYYRLKMIDKDGKFTYSPIRQVSLSHSMLNVSIYPNPAKDALQVEVNSAEKATLQMQIIAQDGKVFLSQQWSVNEGTAIRRFNVSALQSGKYFLKAIANGKETVVVKFEKM